MESIREMLCARERSWLSPYACLSEKTKGRDKPITPCEIRTEFQRDRDRITHCKSFRRLMHKTQVFLSPEADHYRTRLTHTLEVTQIARTIARALRLNEDLCEAIGLGHDLGHTPFGHAGERVLQRCFSQDFTHYRQSLRVVEQLEQNGEGLNLTFEVRDGIVNHTGSCIASTLEGVIVKYADRIAYINHDIDDACRAGILSETDLPADLRQTLGFSHGNRINTMVNSVIRASENQPFIRMEEEIAQATNALRNFLFQRVYVDSAAKSEEGKAEALLETLYHHFFEHPEEMPADCRRTLDTEGVARCVCDYIAGMTDRYAINLYKDLFLPEAWHGRNL